MYALRGNLMAYRFVLAASTLVILGAGCLYNRSDVLDVVQGDVIVPSEQAVFATAVTEPIAEVPVDELTPVVSGEAEEDQPVDIEEPMAPLEVTLEAGNFFFSNNSITARPGQDVVITFSRVDGAHTFIIDELGISKIMTTGGFVSFTAPITPGQYPYFCNESGHQKLGMEGVLIVE